MGGLTKEQATRLIERILAEDPEFRDSEWDSDGWLTLYRPCKSMLADLRDWDCHVEEGLEPFIDVLFGSPTEDVETCAYFVDRYWNFYDQVCGSWFDDMEQAAATIEAEARVHLDEWRDNVMRALDTARLKLP
jgi:hypothetical protein